MSQAARVGDLVVGGVHCHGHTHAPPATPGRIITGSPKVFVDKRAAARAGDTGYSPLCCGGIGRIDILQSQQKVFVDGLPLAVVGTPTIHCGMAPGNVQTGSGKVNVS